MAQAVVAACWAQCKQGDLYCLLLQERLNQLEADLAQWRNKMQLGYKDPKSGEFRKASSVQLRNTMRTTPDEATRKACWEVSAVSGCLPGRPSCSLLRGDLQVDSAVGHAAGTLHTAHTMALCTSSRNQATMRQAAVLRSNMCLKVASCRGPGSSLRLHTP